MTERVRGPENRAPRILLVDDDDGIRRAYAKVLQKLGYRVDTAADGREATEFLRGEPIDVIISDISMPHLSGLEFLRIVRQHDLDVPVLLMTGAPDLGSATQAIEYGAFRYLFKSVELDKLAEVVRQADSMHKMARFKREALRLAGSGGKQLGDRASLDARFNNALERLWVAYQPIVDWSKRSVFAYEALVRSDEPSLKRPPDLLDAAERLDRVHDLGRVIRARVAASASDAPEGVLLFVNLHAADLNDPELCSADSPLAAVASRVVLEVTERSSLLDVTSISDKCAQLRALGYRIAIDDLGAGYAGLSSFSQLEPEFVKLDMSLVRGLDKSSAKRSMVRAMAQLCANELAIQVVSEGVETTGERDVLALEGCNLLQGYLFAKPERGFAIPQW